MKEVKPEKERAFSLLLTILSYGLMGSFAICFLLDHFYFSDFDIDRRLWVAYGQLFSIGGWFFLWVGFFVHKYFFPDDNRL